jgi:hypothetical protein
MYHYWVALCPLIVIQGFWVPKLCGAIFCSFLKFWWFKGLHLSFMHYALSTRKQKTDIEYNLKWTFGFTFFFLSNRFDGTLSVVPKVIPSIFKISNFSIFPKYFEPSLIWKRIQFHLHYIDSIRQKNCATICQTRSPNPQQRKKAKLNSNNLMTDGHSRPQKL